MNKIPWFRLLGVRMTIHLGQIGWTINRLVVVAHVDGSRCLVKDRAEAANAQLEEHNLNRTGERTAAEMLQGFSSTFQR